MNLFASHTFLDAVADVYFPSQPRSVEDHSVDGKVFRLLTIGARGPLTRHPFLDMHEPVTGAVNDPPARAMRWLPLVSHGVVPVDEFKANPEWSRFSAAPTTIWDGFPDWDDYLEELRRRRVLREDQRRRRRLEELVGPLTFNADDRDPDVLRVVFSWKSTRLRRLRGIDLFAVPQNREFFRELRARRVLQVSTLRGSGRLLAAWLGAVHERRWYGWIFAFDSDPALARYSVGRQLLYPMLENSYREGHLEFDFSNGCEPYKLYFATHVRVIGPLGKPPVHYRVRRTLRDCIRSTPRMYATMQAARRALEREVFRVRCALSPRRGQSELGRSSSI